MSLMLVPAYPRSSKSPAAASTRYLRVASSAFLHVHIPFPLMPQGAPP